MAKDNLTVNLEDTEYRRHYVVGDIHSNMNDLATVLAYIHEDGYDRLLDGLFFLGDYIDNYGKGEAREVVKTIRKMCEWPDVWAIRGNHEQLLIDAIDKPMSSNDFQVWWVQGGRNTYDSYYDKKDKRKTEQWDVKLDITDEFKSDIEWFKTLPTLIFTHDYVFVHGGLLPVIGIATNNQKRMWVREEFLDSTFDFGRVVVHGHTSGAKVEVRPNRINLDTSKYGKVSAVRLQEGRSPVFMDKYGIFSLVNGEEIYKEEGRH